MSAALDTLLGDIRGCRLCAAHLPLGPNPVIRARSTARLMIIGQAPSTRVHASSIPWNDASGNRLRTWLGIDRDRFYDDRKIAIMPMGFCYPGLAPSGGDAPPRPECAPQWHARVLALLPHITMTLLVGHYAQKRYLPHQTRRSMTENVRHFRRTAPSIVPLPHPSWRNTGWIRRHPWFEAETLPWLRETVAGLLSDA